MNRLKKPSLPFGTKAETLLTLTGKVKTAMILPQISFTVAEWGKNKGKLLRDISRFDYPLIVRSSAEAEDSHTASNAGAFLSVGNIKTPAELEDAIEAVIRSYEHHSPFDQVLIQPFLSHVQLAGVALTRDPGSGGHYFIINYDENGGTGAITGGRCAAAKTYICSKSGKTGIPAPMDKVIALARELERLMGADSLDIEFALANDELYLFQVRPLILPAGDTGSPEYQEKLLSEIERKIESGMHPHPYLHGMRTAYGVMPDWNPAEIIGLRPKPLALSLYRDLITDSIWSYQRNNYGYKNLRSFPLMVHFFGLPYVDVRVSLNSFIPREIEGGLADRLANYYLDCLLAAPSLHDKVEFEIVYSCYTLDLPERLSKLKEFAFSDADIEVITQSLRQLTNGIIRRDGLWHIDKEKLAVLTRRREQIMSADIADEQRIYWLLEDCKRYGTLPFAGLARAAFIAVQMMRSLVQAGILSEVEYDAFMGGINTVSSQITRDFGHLDRGAFLAKYGHLRPGTYDILSPRYDEAPDLYFDWSKSPAPERKYPDFALSLSQMQEINRLLEHHGLEYDVVGLFEFIATAIEWREQSKFIFSRSLSDALSVFKRYGESLGFTPDDLSYADINIIRELNAASLNARELIANSIVNGRALYEKSLQLQLPPLISSPRDAWGFFVPSCEPNFVTRKSITGKVACHSKNSDLAGAIVAIESADPGFDWIFSHSIGGLITAYGGTNSHMAIRAGELGLPAVIGAGDALFKRWISARMLKIDCANRRVDVLQ